MLNHPNCLTATRNLPAHQEALTSLPTAFPNKMRTDQRAPHLPPANFPFPKALLVLMHLNSGFQRFTFEIGISY